MEIWLLLVIIIAFIGLGLWWVRRPVNPKVLPQVPAAPTNTLIRTQAPPAASTNTSLFQRLGRLPLWRTLGLGLLIVVVLGLGGWLGARWGWFGVDERPIIGVAYFVDPGNGQTGRNVSTALVRALEEQVGDRAEVRLIESMPSTAATALDLAQRNDIEWLIWGSVEAGAVFDSPTMQPNLIYTPFRPHAANAWDGFSGRFTMPRNYTLTTEPINGRAVMPDLFEALLNYQIDNPDLAFDQLDRLSRDYPFADPLPRALRGNILWARGLYRQAAEEYRLALNTSGADRAFLANNLGAILMDAGDPAARDAFNEAVTLLDERDLGALRYNLGLLALRERRVSEAIDNLEPARDLIGPNMRLSLALTEAYRDAGRHTESMEALQAAEQQAPRDRALTTSSYRQLVLSRHDALLREQRALNEIAVLAQSRGRLLWWLEIAEPLPSGRLGDIREQMRTARSSAESSVSGWRQRAVAEAAANPGSGLISGAQSERAELLIREIDIFEAHLLVEIDRVRLTGVGGGLFSGLFGQPPPMRDSLAVLGSLVRSGIDDPSLINVYGRANRLADDLPRASQLHEQVIALSPNNPEGFFGLGMVALENGDLGAAIQRFNEALSREPTFFPARLQIAIIEEQAGNLAGAIEQYRILAEQQPGLESSLMLAQALRRSGPEQFAEAQALLQSYRGDSAAALIELGYLYRDAGELEAARESFAAALDRDSASAEAAFQLGQLLETAGDYNGAEAQYRIAVRNDPDNLEVRIALADLYQGPLDQPNSATEQYRAALQIGVRNPDQIIAIGDALYEDGSYLYALQAFTEAERQQPNDPAIQYRLGQAYLQLDRLTPAAEAQAEALALLGDSQDVNLRAAILASAGEIELRRGFPAQAEESFRQSLALNPNQPAATIGLGRTAIANNNWGVALGHFEQAVNLPAGAEDPLAFFWHGEALLRNGLLNQAVMAYGQAITLRPQFPEALLGLAQAQLALGDPTAAEQTVDRAIGQRSNYAEGLLFKAKLLQESGNIDQAVATYSASINANREIAESYYRRGVLYIRQTEYGRAISDLRRATQIQPNFPEALYWLGRALYAQGNEQNALEALREAVRLQPDYTEARFYQGLVEEDMGLRDEAINTYQTVIQTDSGLWSERATAQLQRLQ